MPGKKAKLEEKLDNSSIKEEQERGHSFSILSTDYCNCIPSEQRYRSDESNGNIYYPPDTCYCPFCSSYRENGPD